MFCIIIEINDMREKPMYPHRAYYICIKSIIIKPAGQISKLAEGTQDLVFLLQDTS
jgi:hypothetical protein